jgi:DNA primase
MRYPQTFIDDLKRQADIVRVIQDYVQLKKKGANWMACCPFHKEKTPSFSVSPSKEIFYCFGCHKGGTVFNFVMEIEHVGFPEAIKIVADKVGMPLPKTVDDERFEARRRESDLVIELNSWAMEWWQQQLESSNEGRIARDYLKERGITEETRKTFRLGYAPDSWDSLLIYLRNKGASQDHIDRSGLVARKEETNRSYDRFRGRLMVPVLDAQGRPIAFGGRTLKGEDAKYINSPETAAYVKGRNLFGLNLTREEIRRQGFAILVEGFLDLIVPYQFGVRNMVASLGTALTADQVKLLSRFARKVVVNYDGDRAGVQAAKKAIEILLAEDLDVKVLVLPDNADPDEYIRKFGVAEYQRQRAQSLPHIQFVIDEVSSRYNLTVPREKDAAIEEVLRYVGYAPTSIQLTEYLQIVMDRFKVPRGEREKYWRRVKSLTGKTWESSPKEVKQKEIRKPPTAAEQRFLSLLLNQDELRRKFLTMLEPKHYEYLPTAEIFRALVEIEREGMPLDYQTLSVQIGEDGIDSDFLPSLFDANTLHATEEEFTPEKCLAALRLMQIDYLIELRTSELANAQRAGDEEEITRLAMEHFDLSRQKKSLQANVANVPIA